MDMNMDMNMDMDMNMTIVDMAAATAAANGIVLPTAAVFFGAVVLAYMLLMLMLMDTDHTIISLLKMNATKKGTRPPVAPFGMFECIRYMTSEQQPWFPLRARKVMHDTDTFVLPLPRRPVMTGDASLAREILMDPLSIKPKTYQEFEPFGVGSIFTRNGSYWVSNKVVASCRVISCHVTFCVVLFYSLVRCCDKRQTIVQYICFV